MRSGSTFAGMHCDTHSDVLNKSVTSNRDYMLMPIKHKNTHFITDSSHSSPLDEYFSSLLVSFADVCWQTSPAPQQKLHWNTQEKQQWLTVYYLCPFVQCMSTLFVPVEIMKHAHWGEQELFASSLWTHWRVCSSGTCATQWLLLHWLPEQPVRLFICQFQFMNS